MTFFGLRLTRVLALGLALATIALAGPAEAARRVALVIGNSTYQSVPTLANPTNDADDIGQKLTDLGFEVIVGKDLDRAGMAATLGRFIGALRGADSGLFYYAGHGIQYEGQNYLIGTAATLENQFALSGDAISLDEIIGAMEATVPTNLVFLDACRDNPFSERLQESLGPQRSARAPTGLAPVKAKAGKDTMIVYATAANQTAEDGGGSNSPFAASLLQHMATPGVEVSLLFKRVIQDVREATAFRQSPEILSAMATEFYFVDAAPTLPLASNELASVSAASDEELTAYKVATAQNTLGGWKSFIEQYADGPLAPFARDALIVLEGQQAKYDPNVSFQELERQLALVDDDRISVQRTLNALGYGVGTEDGDLGPRSRRAIFAFQVERGLMPTGYVDAATRARLFSEEVQSEAARSFDFAAGLTGMEAEIALQLTPNEVRTIALGLASMRYDAGLGLGQVDPRLRSALKQYQFKTGLTPDGYFTADTARDLIDLGRKNGATLARVVDPQSFAEGVDPRLVAAARKFFGLPIKYGYFGATLYVAVIRSVQFDHALEKVEGSGGHLVVFSSADEKEFVDELITGDDRFFSCNLEDIECYGPAIGYYQEATAKRSRDGWVSVTGEPVQQMTWSRSLNDPNQLDLSNQFGFAMYGDREAPTRFLMDMGRFVHWASGFIVEFPLAGAPEGV